MPIVGTLQLSGCNYQFGWDLVSQSIANNTSTVSFYGILNVTNNYVSWSSGTAWIHTAQAGLSTRYNKGSYVVVQSYFTFTHNNDGTLTLAPGYGLTTTYTSGNGTVVIQLPTIARKVTTTSAPDFNDETNSIDVTFTNPANFQSIPYIAFYLGNQYQTAALRLERPKALYTSPYTWEFTEQEKQQMRQALKDDASCNLSIGFTTYNGNENIGYSSVQRKFNIVNATPVFTNFDVEETNAKVKAVTGSTTNQIINVNGYSNIKAIVPVSDKAIAQKSATMDYYRFIIGDKGDNANYSDSEDIEITINNAPNGTYSIIATDSRKYTTILQRVAVSEKDYSKIALNKSACKVERNNNQVGDSCILTLEGEFWNDNFGVTTNDVTSITYQYKRTTDEDIPANWHDGTTTITPTKSGNTFSFSGEIAGDVSTKWDLGSSYNIKLIVEDYITSDTMDFILNSAVPTLSLDKEGVGINCAYDEQLGGHLQVNGKIVGEDIYSTDEILTNKIWINGKPIYRKVVDFGYLPNNTSKSVNHNISNIDRIINYDLIAWNGTSTLAMYQASLSLMVINVVNKTQCTIITQYDRSSYSAYFTIYYTKTTD